MFVNFNKLFQVNFGDGDLPDYRPYSHRKPSSVTEHFGLAGPQNVSIFLNR